MHELNRLKDYKLVHEKGSSTVVTYESDSGGHLVIVIYQASHLKNSDGRLAVDTKHFVHNELDQAECAALDWAKNNIGQFVIEL